MPSRSDTPNPRWAQLASFSLTFLLLAVVILVVPRPLLLLGRFVPHGGWLEALALAIYAAWLTPKLLDAKQSALWRSRVWWIFTAVFFAQLGLALLGFEAFQMTPGKLHLPIPALIVAGPLYRAEGFFMLILFVSSVVLVGPAWCSHLCYIGAWDDQLAKRTKRPTVLPAWRQPVRIGIALAVVLAALVLRWSGVSPFVAGLSALGFGLAGVAVMVLWSRRTGQMVHCVTFCPIGLAANWLGRASAFRLRIADACTECGACSRVCRYDALHVTDIKARKVGSSCTLCGDCLRTCKGSALQYRVLGLGPTASRTVFVVIVVALHAATLGLARV